MADKRTVRLTINGEEKTIAASTLSEVLVHFDLSPAMIVAEVNGEIIPPDNYDAAVTDGDVIELVRFVGGG